MGLLAGSHAWAGSPDLCGESINCLLRHKVDLTERNKTCNSFSHTFRGVSRGTHHQCATPTYTIYVCLFLITSLGPDLRTFPPLFFLFLKTVTMIMTRVEIKRK